VTRPPVLRAALVAVAALAGTAAAGALAGCAAGHPGAPHLSVSAAYVPRPPVADTAAGYFTVRNSGTGADELTSVTTASAAQAMLMVTTGDGAMREAKDLAIPAGGSLKLSLGGDHVMLMDLKGGRPAVGDRLPFVLHFAHSAPITVKVPVEPATYRPAG
jgi:periplasmic copper chaperone A